MSSLLLYIVLESFSVIAAVFALWKGGTPERLAAAVIILNVAAGDLSKWLAPGNQDFVRLCNDGLAAVALLVITIRYGALWMGGAMLFYAAQFALHSWYLVAERPHDNLHALVNNIDWNGVIWCLIIGTAVAWRQRLRGARETAPAAS
ncbi:MAG: hypothetical protein ACM3II_10600 [Rhodospirillaceae bacterium]